MITGSYLQLKKLARESKKKGKRIVWTNGCFDLFHYGHLVNLRKAAAMGDVLIVGINGDRSPYFKHKPGRPLQNERARAEILEALKYVDWVFIFQEETPLKAIETVIPDVLVKGADYSQKDIVGSKVVRMHGGKIRRIRLVPGHSTTKLIKKIVKTYA